MNPLKALLATLLLAGSNSWGDTWQLLPDSELAFTATQQGAEFEGRFHTFDAEIQFDPADPASGHIKASITLASVDTAYGERDSYLREPEWFNVAIWPTATYTAERIVKSGDKFIAIGILSLRNIDQPVDLSFTFVEKDGETRLTGTAGILRLSFDVGSGEWGNTQWVGNEVAVNVDLALVRAKQQGKEEE